MASFKAIFPVLQELFAKNHRGGPLAPPPAGRGLTFRNLTLTSTRLLGMKLTPMHHLHLTFANILADFGSA